MGTGAVDGDENALVKPTKTSLRKSGRPKGVRDSQEDSGAVSPPMPRSRGRRIRRMLKTSELIARDIILDISEGGLKEGDPLPPEATMLKQYEVGRASIREALRMLEVQGLVQIRAGARGGPVVGAATAENLARMLTLYFGLAGATYEQLTEVMLLLYPMVAAVAASRKLSAAEVQALHESVDQACGVPNPRLIRTETLKDFHSLLSQFARNPVWALMTDAVGLVFADHIISTADSREFHAQTVADHKQIAQAVLAGDEALARRTMLAHTQRMIEFYRTQTPAIFSQIIEWR
jgi:GntR family transcriptional regulator, transcriptional repressor for pyruvate dehydrogenase complex